MLASAASSAPLGSRTGIPSRTGYRRSDTDTRCPSSACSRSRPTGQHSSSSKPGGTSLAMSPPIDWARIGRMERLVLASQGGWETSSARYRLGALAREGPWPIEAIAASSIPTADQVARLVDRGGDDAGLILQ